LKISHEAKAGEVTLLMFYLLILLWAGGVVTEEVEVDQGRTRLGHDLLELLVLLIPEVVLLLIVTFVAGVILVLVLVLVRGVELLLLLLGQSVMKWMVSPHWRQPLSDLLLSLWNLCKAWNFLASRVISSFGMLSYCSSEATIEKDKANFKADRTVVLVELASWPPTQALVIKALLEREASWFGWPFLHSSWDLSIQQIPLK
jgi:hypothetical protein